MRPNPKAYSRQNRLTMLEDTALNLTVELLKERRYNRTMEEYAAIAERLPPIKVLHGRVNDRLRRIAEIRTAPRLYHFQAREQHASFKALPASISLEVVRSALVKSGMRTKQERRPRAPSV